MNELALFTGVGGGLLGSRLLGWRTICGVEKDTFCREILLRRQIDGCLPIFPIWTDIRTFNGKPWNGLVDIITGGFPCQPFSSASRGRRVAPDLFPEMVRVISEVRPRYVFAENVQREPIETARKGLEELGYGCKCLKLGASDLGADHIRRRYWILGDTHHQGQLGVSVHDEMEILPRGSINPWQAQPVGVGVSNGVSARMDVIRAAGNGQVPIVASMAFLILKTAMDKANSPHQ